MRIAEGNGANIVGHPMVKSDFSGLPQMNTLKENIVKSTATVNSFDDEIRNTESSILTQRTISSQAVGDNETKSGFNSAVAILETTNLAKIVSVVVTQEELQQALAPLKQLQSKLNGTNIDANEQKQKLQTLETKLSEQRAKRQTEADLLLSYRLQLKVAIDKQRQELEAMEALLRTPVPEAKNGLEEPNQQGGQQGQADVPQRVVEHD